MSRWAGWLAAVGVWLCGLLLFSPAVGLAASGSPGLSAESFAAPSVFSAADTTRCEELFGGGCDGYQVTVTNAGSVATEGPVTIADSLPAGLTVKRIHLFWLGESVRTEFTGVRGLDLGAFLCDRGTVTCRFPGILEEVFGARSLLPDDRLEMIVDVTADPSLSGPLVNRVAVSGGGSPDASAESVNRAGDPPAAFGLSEFGFAASGLDGGLDRQAGDHPYELTTTIGLNSVFRELPDTVGKVGKTSVQDVRDVVVDLPLGFVGSTLAAPRCTLAQLSSEGGCPADTQVGRIYTEPVSGVSVDSPIWNVVPERGVAGEFGYIDALRASHVLTAHVVPSAAGYVLQVRSIEVPQVSLDHVIVTFYGNPTAKEEERARHREEELTGEPARGGGNGRAQVPFFTNPTLCSAAAQTATIHVDSWKAPGRFNADGTPDLSDHAWVSASSSSPPPTGCDLLRFDGQLQAQPTTHAADSPSGLDFELKLAQSEIAGTLASPPLKRAVVKLPPGMTVDPSAGDGLVACSIAQIGWAGPSPVNFDPAPPACPEASRIGTLELETPLIGGVLRGAVYLAAQDENPFHSTLAAYVVVDDPVTGVLVKIAGKLTTDPDTGQITAVFDENPQLPFSDLKLRFFGGPRAELATPESCGLFTTDADLAPWSAPGSGPDALLSDSFSVESGCVTGFAPSFTAGSMNLQAGAYTTFAASFSRTDTDQQLAGVSVNLPPGLLAKITGVPLCSDADAGTGSCPEASRVATVQASAGPGPNPLLVAGKAFLTGPYKGAPYGLDVVVPALAGPYDFGNVNVRQALYIDPHDAHVTDVSDPFPTILKPTGADGETIGIPIRLRRVDIAIDRPGFTFNPTNCSKLQIAAAVESTQNTTSPISVPFQISNCASLRFTPKFTVTTSGRTSKANGASLTAKLVYPNAPQGTQADIGRVKVDLPRQLPSRLTTLQKACRAATFAANPANCPAASIIGHARVSTPLLPEPLTGPAYFVSHGGEAFPTLTIVLQGDNVTIQLVGNTLIRNGITSTTFKSTPDVPFNTFELNLPQGRTSALAANGNLCKAKLVMPTLFTAQNGRTLKQSTPIHTTNCPKKRRHHTHHRHKRRR